MPAPPSGHARRDERSADASQTLAPPFGRCRCPGAWRHRATLACLDSVLATLPRRSRLIVIDDASPDPDLVEALDNLARRRRIRLIRNERNLGFAASANIGMRAASGRDVVLLNSDTLVAPGWLEGLRAVAYSAPDIGTVTPLSNDATILSYPDPTGGNPVPDLPATARLAAHGAPGEWRRGGRDSRWRRVLPVPPARLSRSMSACSAPMCSRKATARRTTSACAPAIWVGAMWRRLACSSRMSAATRSAPPRRHLQARNELLLERMHPGYAELIAALPCKADPLAEARRRLDLARWRAARRRGGQRGHADHPRGGGGVERQIAASARRHIAPTAIAPSCCVHPARQTARDASRVSDGMADGFPNLRYALPDELPALQRLLAAERPTAIELHHMFGHHPADTAT